MKILLEGRYAALTLLVLVALWCFAAVLFESNLLYYLWFPIAVSLGLIAVGIHDLLQTKRAILRNYPIIGHLRYFFEKIRPEMRQYFFEADTDGQPFPREKRAIVYQRAKRQLDKKPFGTQSNVAFHAAPG
jgi:hypothetical protein